MDEMIPKTWKELADEAERLGAIIAVQVTVSCDRDILPGSILWGCTIRKGGKPLNDWDYIIYEDMVWRVHILDSSICILFAIDCTKMQWWVPSDFTENIWYKVCRVILPGVLG